MTHDASDPLIALNLPSSHRMLSVPRHQKLLLLTRHTELVLIKHVEGCSSNKPLYLIARLSGLLLKINLRRTLAILTWNARRHTIIEIAAVSVNLAYGWVEVEKVSLHRTECRI